MTTHIFVDVFYRQYSEVDSICGEQMFDSMTMGSRDVNESELDEPSYTKVYKFEFPREEGEIDIREYTFTVMNGMNPDYQLPQGLRCMMAGDYIVIKTVTDYATLSSKELCLLNGWKKVEPGNTPVPFEHPGDPS
jgi:hypothetical protein